MPRRYYRRTRVIRPKKKWASNIGDFQVAGSNSETATTGTMLAADYIVARNNAQYANPTPVIVKAGNVKVQGTCTFSVNSTAGATVQVNAYVIYKPEGVDWHGTASELNPALALSFANTHPEWIMGCKAITTQTLSAGGVSEPVRFSFSSRLKRNLNSGDRIMMLYVAKTLGEGENSLNVLMVSGIVQYWTCAN